MIKRKIKVDQRELWKKEGYEEGCLEGFKRGMAKAEAEFEIKLRMALKKERDKLKADLAEREDQVYTQGLRDAGVLKGQSVA